MSYASSPNPRTCVSAGEKKTKYNVLAFLIDSRLTTGPQIAHADNGTEGSFAVAARHVEVPVNVLYALRRNTDTYLDVRPLQHRIGHVRVKIPYGHCLIFRGDVVHRGVEGLNETPNVRLFVHLIPDHWRHADDRGAKATFPAAVDFDEHLRC